MPSKQAKLESWLKECGGATVTPDGFDELLRLLAPIAESDLRHRLRSTGATLHPLVAGVNQDSFSTLEESLLALGELYEQGVTETRRIVITAKDHAKLAAKTPRTTEAKREHKAEMAAWMLTWLENPAIFPIWVSLRKKSMAPEILG